MSDSQPARNREQCPYGFTCSRMTSQPNTTAINCWFVKDCRKLKKSSNSNIDDKLKQFLQQISELREELARLKRLQPNQKQKAQIKYLSQRKSFLCRVIAHEIAISKLEEFGNPLSAESFGIYEEILQIKKSIGCIKTQINNFSGLSNLNRNYIAPEGVEVHTYSVKHPPSSKFPPGTPLEEIRTQQKIYKYHKLLSKTAQFKSETNSSRNCKVIHLGKNDSEKNIQARLGIERRNRLSKIRTLVTQAAEALQEAAELANEVLLFEDVSKDKNS